MLKNHTHLEHTRPVCEFSEVKDTAHNLRVACFTEGSILRSGMEALIYHRCVAIQLVVKEANIMRVVLVTNSDEFHSRFHPKPLPKMSNRTTEVVSSHKEENKIGIIKIDFSTVKSTKLVQEARPKDGLGGLSFFDAVGKCVLP